jgi:hypothetical protein
VRRYQFNAESSSGQFDENGLRSGSGKTTLPNGVVHTGVYKSGRPDYAAKCTLTVPAGAPSSSLEPGSHEGKLQGQDLKFETGKVKKKAVDVAPLLGADSLLTAQR